MWGFSIDQVIALYLCGKGILRDSLLKRGKVGPAST